MAGLWGPVDGIAADADVCVTVRTVEAELAAGDNSVVDASLHITGVVVLVELSKRHGMATAT